MCRTCADAERRVEGKRIGGDKRVGNYRTQGQAGAESDQGTTRQTDNAAPVCFTITLMCPFSNPLCADIPIPWFTVH